MLAAFSRHKSKRGVIISFEGVQPESREDYPSYFRSPSVENNYPMRDIDSYIEWIFKKIANL